MFCRHCGKTVDEAFTFCPSCGTRTGTDQRSLNNSMQVSASQTTDQTSCSSALLKEKAPSFKQFYQRKEGERSSKFVPKSIKARCDKKVNINDTVTINIGIMEMECIDKDTLLKPMRGQSLPLKVLKSDDCSKVLNSAILKRKAYDQHFDTTREYKLVYPDGQTCDKLPGSSQDFTVDAYKKDLGKGYARIILYLCPVKNEEKKTHEQKSKNIRDYTEQINLSSEESDFDLDDDRWFLNSPFLDVDSQIAGGSSKTLPIPPTPDAPSTSQEILYIPTDFVPVGVTESEAVGEAIERSLQEFQDVCELTAQDASSHNTSEQMMQTTVKDHVDKHLTGDPRRIVVSRMRIWDTAKAFFKRKTFMAKKGILKETFATFAEEEDAIDNGGPRREFLHLLLGAICQESGTLTSSSVGYVVRCNMRAMQNGDYLTIGQMLATIIVQGGEHPRIFSQSICNYIAKGYDSSHPTIEEIPDPTIQSSLRKLEDANDETSFSTALAECNWRFDVDGLPINIHFNQKRNFINEVAKYYTIIKCKGMLDDIVEGLKYYKVLNMIQDCDGMAQYLLHYRSNDRLSGKEVLMLLKPNLSPNGHKRRPDEEVILAKFIEFVNCIEDATLQEILAEQTDLTKEENDFIGSLTPGHVLLFVTGATSSPVVGFDPKPSIKFVHDESRFIPCAQTCANILFLYVNQKTIAGPFHHYMLTGLMNGGVFSRL